MAERKKPPILDRSKSGGDIVHLYDTAKVQDILQGLTLASVQEQDEIDKPFSERGLITEEGAIPLISDKMFCSYCNADFSDRAQQTDHYKTDWHRFNLKQKLRGRTFVTEDRFEEITGGDISSISGSESGDCSSSSEDEGDKTVVPSVGGQDETSWHVEGIGRRHPRVFFRNNNSELLSIYRCVIYSKKNQPDHAGGVVTMATELPNQMMWAIFMTAGGHFAGAIFDKGEVVRQKTFHRYVVRAKRGTAQSQRDKTGNAPKSAGASLRRYNEAALTQDIHDLFGTWADDLKKCERIFLRAPSFNRAIFFGGKSPVLSKADERVRMIPFQTRRPTHKELLRVHATLAEIHCYGQESQITDHIKVSPQKVTSTKVKEEESQLPNLEKLNIQEALAGDEGDDDSSSGTELHIQDELVDLSQHQQFECTRKPRRRKNKKKIKAEVEKADNKKPALEKQELDVETLKLSNMLYTACKVGDSDGLAEVLTSLSKLNQNDTTGEIQRTNQDPSGKTNTTLLLGADNMNQNKTEDEVRTSNNQLEGTPCDVEAESARGAIVSNHDAVVVLLNRLYGTPAQTLLHLAAAGGHKDIIRILMESGADPCTLDAQGKVPYLASADKETKNEFRRFVSQHPDKYDYTAAKIPGALTAEMEAEKKAREAKKKKVPTATLR